MMNSQIIAIWGSPSSGKTTTSVKLAKALSEKKKNVIVVFADIIVPTLLTILPTVGSEGKSLGRLLAEPELTQETILKNLITMRKNDYISFLGYGKAENKFTYAKYSKDKIIDFMVLLRHLSDYVIIDCSSIITDDLFTAMTLEIADKVLRLSSCDIKGLSYMSSYLPLLSERRFGIEKHIKILSNTNDSMLKSEMTESLSGIDLYIPYVKELSDQYLYGELFQTLTTKGSKAYSNAIDKLMKGVFNE